MDSPQIFGSSPIEMSQHRREDGCSFPRFAGVWQYTQGQGIDPILEGLNAVEGWYLVLS